jgi:hypothetical protein
MPTVYLPVPREIVMGARPSLKGSRAYVDMPK